MASASVPRCTSVSWSCLGATVSPGAPPGPQNLVRSPMLPTLERAGCAVVPPLLSRAECPKPCSVWVTRLSLFVSPQACKVQSTPGLPSLARCGPPACPLLVSPHPPLRNLPIGVSQIPPSPPRLCTFL